MLRLVNGVQGITWRLGFGVVDSTQPEGMLNLINGAVFHPLLMSNHFTEWQPRPATLNLPITADM